MMILNSCKKNLRTFSKKWKIFAKKTRNSTLIKKKTSEIDKACQR